MSTLTSNKQTISKVRDGAPGASAGQYSIRTDAEEILKFNRSYDLDVYDFAPSTELQIQAFDLKQQMVIPIMEYLKVSITSTEFNADKTRYYYLDDGTYVQCTESSTYSSSTDYYTRNHYFTIEIDLAGYRLSQIIKQANYSEYVYFQTEAIPNTDPVQYRITDEYSYYFGFVQLYTDLYSGALNNKLEGESAEKAEIIDSLKLFFQSLGSEDIVISIAIHELDESIVNLEKYLSIKNGLSDQMAKFSVNAADITAAIQNTKLAFNSDGLTVTNGGIKIISNNEDVFYIDNDTGELKMVGNGTFTGTIYANAGQFTGSITSTTGNIGGFEIGEHYIKSTDLELYSSYTGNESRIKVKNIDIGNGANVSGSITIGNLKLLNPQENDNKVLTLITKDSSDNDVNYFTLLNNGEIQGNNWSIVPDNDDGAVATFGKLIANNGVFSGTIHASDGDFSGEIRASVINASTINAASFTTANTRAMGGSFIFKPTFQIESIETVSGSSNIIKVTLSNDTDMGYFPSEVSGKDIIVSLSGNGTSYGKIQTGENYGVDTENKIVYVFLYSVDYSTITTQADAYNTLTLFGYGNYTDLLIGINSDNNSVVLPPRALVMEEFTNLQDVTSTGDINYRVRLLLGDLSGAPEGTGYGLYADNVFLRGSLTTAGGELSNTYAGINTLRTVAFNYNSWKAGAASTDVPTQYTTDKIIFWGGANGADDTSIQISPFIVTDKGNVFARSGEFKGSVISDSLITNTIIKAPVIWGNNTKTNEPALKIYNTDNTKGGIGFYRQIGDIDDESAETDDKLTLLLSNQGFIHYYDTGSKAFVSFNESNNQISIDITNLNLGTTTLRQNYIEDNNNASIYVNGADGGNINLTYGSTSVNISATDIINNAGTVTNKNSMIVTNDTQMLKYTVNSNNYYCLYVE